MKNLLFTIVACVISQAAIAQKKHSFALGCDYVTYVYPSEWNSPKIVKSNRVNTTLSDDIGAWVAYYYKNKFSARLYFNYFIQDAYYKNKLETPDNFIDGRQTTFNDLTFGYNLIHRNKFAKKLAVWCYGGIGITGMVGMISSITYVEAFGHFAGGNRGRSFEYKVYPTAQVMVKYNPIKYVFVGLGGTYHYLFPELQPVSGNITLGFQL